MSGWIAVKRGLMDHDLFRPDGKWSKAEAWIWIIENAAFKDTVIDVGGKPHTVPRGGLCFSERFMADKFGWSQKALRAFLYRLEAHGAIVQDIAKTGEGTKSRRKQITLCNYEKYQSHSASAEAKDATMESLRETVGKKMASKGNQSSACEQTEKRDSGIKTESKRNQNGSKDKQITNIPTTSGADAPVDPVKILFDGGVRVLGAGGVPDRQARSLIGRWRGQHGDEAVLSALGRSQREGAVDPVSFIEGCLRAAQKRKANQYGDERVTASGQRQVYDPACGGWQNVYA